MESTQSQRERPTPWRRRPHPCLRDPSCYLVPMPTLPSLRESLSCRCHPRETYLAAYVGCLICPAQPSFVAPAFIVHMYLIYHFLQTLIKCLWILESNNLCLWTCGVCVFTNEWWTNVGEWWLWIESMLLVVFFFFSAFWLFGFVTLCHFVLVTLSLVFYR